MERFSNVVAIEIPAGDPGKRPDLEALINAQFSAERWSGRLHACAKLIGWLSLPMAYLLYLGPMSNSQSARVILTIWLVLLFFTIISAESRGRARRRLDQLLARTGARRIESAD